MFLSCLKPTSQEDDGAEAEGSGPCEREVVVVEGEGVSRPPSRHSSGQSSGPASRHSSGGRRQHRPGQYRQGAEEVRRAVVLQKVPSEGS